jgi:glyoxylase-like metal-dependent hydrolase (beta-lactamase superfamily II)
MAYLIVGTPSILIDAGAGPSANDILILLEKAGVAGNNLGFLFLTHCHVDHIGGAAYFKEHFPGLKIVAHAGDAKAIQTGDPVKTAATWYGTNLPPLEIDNLFEGDKKIIEAAPTFLTLLHTPGHTPGSCVAVVEREGHRILFGQDIHGPFMPEFGSDLSKWHISMERLLGLEADILCEGHYGIIVGKEAVRHFIQQYLHLHGF